MTVDDHLTPAHTETVQASAMARGGRITAPAALVVAHPDDETLWVGSALARFDRLLMIHITDGAPLEMRDAAALGIGERERYAALRSAELGRALEALDVAPERRYYGIVDQEAANHLPELIDRLADDLAGVSLVITHPYEGGHPDHDSLAFAVRAAVEQIGRQGASLPAIVEFACYHAVDGRRQFGRFWPDATCPEQVRELADEECARLDAAIAAHASQAAVIGGWRPSAERWRAAPRYDFTRPPPPGEALYDGFGWAMTSQRWRDRAAEVLACP